MVTKRNPYEVVADSFAEGAKEIGIAPTPTPTPPPVEAPVAKGGLSPSDVGNFLKKAFDVVVSGPPSPPDLPSTGSLVGEILEKSSLVLDPVAEVAGPHLLAFAEPAIQTAFPGTDFAQRNPASEAAVGRFFTGEMSGPEVAGFLREAFSERGFGEQLALGAVADPLIALAGAPAIARTLGRNIPRFARGAQSVAKPERKFVLFKESPEELTEATIGAAEESYESYVMGPVRRLQIFNEETGEPLLAIAARRVPEPGSVFEVEARGLSTSGKALPFSDTTLQNTFSRRELLRIADDVMEEIGAKELVGFRLGRDIPDIETARGITREQVKRGLSRGRDLSSEEGFISLPKLTTGTTPQPAGSSPLMGPLTRMDTVVEVATRPDMWREIVNLPVVRNAIRPFNLSAVAEEPVERAIVGRAVLRDQGEQLTRNTMSHLGALGTQEQVFGKLDEGGLLLAGPFKGLTVNTLRSAFKKYHANMTNVQREWVRIANNIEFAKLDFLKRSGIEVNQLEFAEGGTYAGRRLFAKITKDGEVIEVATTAGPGRLGAKTASEKMRVFKTQEEAIAEGYRYLPEDEALALNVQGAYNRVADKNMVDWLLPQIPHRTSAAPHALVFADNQAKKALDKAEQIDEVINRSVSGQRIAPQTIASITRAHPDLGAELKTVTDAIASGSTQTGYRVASLIRKSKQKVAELTTQSQEASNRLSVARRQAQTASFEEAVVPLPAFGGKFLQGPGSAEVAKTLTSAMDPRFNSALAMVNQANAVSRYFLLAGDASLATIQLLFFAGYKPKQYAKAMTGFTRALFDTRFHDQYLRRPENIAIAQKYPNLIMSKGGATEFTAAMARGGLLRRGPLAFFGKRLEPFQRGFETGLDVAGIELAKSLDHMAKTPAQIDDLTQFINEFRGLTSSARLGISSTQRQLETAVTLAPRYTRAIAALMFDMTRGGLRGSLARRAMAQGVLATLAMTTAISYAMGKTHEEVIDHLNPTSPHFLTWQIGGQNIGPGTKVRSVVKLLAAAWSNPDKLTDLSIGWGDAEFIQNPLIRFVRGQSSPVLSISWDLLTGKDFIGNQTRPEEWNDRQGYIELTKTIGERLIPIWVQSALIEGGGAQGRALRGVSEFGGMRTYPQNPFQDAAYSWRDELNEYKDIKEATDRIRHRRVNPELDAKLFILGRVSTLRSVRARYHVQRLMKEFEMSPQDLAEGDEENPYEKVFGTLQLLDVTSKQSQGTPSKWQEVSRWLDSNLLRALDKVWNRGGKLSAREDRQLRRVFEQVPLGEDNFRTWLMRTLRQAQSAPAPAQ
jgi:hypothetical protein